MRIWLDTSYHKSRVGTDCGDCNPPGEVLASFLRPPIDAMRALTLQYSQSLYIQEYSEGYWLVCNTSISGRMAVLDAQAMALLALFQTPTILAHIVAQGMQKELEEAISLFYSLGFLYAKDCNAFPLSREEPQILTVWLHVTNECNLRCHYCYIYKTHEYMPNEVGRRSVDAILRSAQKRHIKIVQLKYAGGEASLHMMSVIALHDYAVQQASEYGITVSAVMLSNGVVLSQQSIEALKARQIAVTISLDGLGSYHDGERPLIGGQGSSKYVLRTIDRLLANMLIPSLSVTVSLRNLLGLPDFMEYILAHDLPFSLNYYRANDFSTFDADLNFSDQQIIAAMRSTFAVIEKNLPERSLLGSLLDKANMSTTHHRTCGVGQNYLVINQRGGVAKCQMDIQRTVTTIDSADPLKFVRDDHDGIQGLNVEEKEGCRTCSWRYWCTGGCPMLTYRSTGRYDVKSPYCNIYTTLFPDVLRLEALRLRRYAPSFALNDSKKALFMQEVYP
jgi:uncharacterized protein